MVFGNMFKSGLAAAALALVATAAQATPQYFFGNLPTAGGLFPSDSLSPPRVAQGNFMSAVEVTGTQTVESATPGALSGAPYNFSNSMSIFSGGTLRQTQPEESPRAYNGVTVKSGSSSQGRFNTTGGAATGRWIESDWSFTIDVGSNVGAFGFYGTDFADFMGALVIELYAGNTLVEDNAFTDAAGAPVQPRSANETLAAQNGSLLFFGYASSTTFDRIVFKIGQQDTGPLDTLGFDDIVVGNLKAGVTPPPGPNPAPEPGSLALAGLALVAAGWARRAQRRA